MRVDPSLQTPVATALRDEAPVRYDDAEVVTETATSRDGTHVPVMVIRRRGTQLDGRNPTLLGGYGGYGVSMTPSYSPTNRLWLDRGGVVAVAILRGGGGGGAHGGGPYTRAREPRPGSQGRAAAVGRGGSGAPRRTRTQSW